MNWIKVKDQKPKNYQQCWVMHIKRCNYQFRSIYFEKDDTFRLIEKDTTDYPLHITHWVAMPEMMSEENEKQKELEVEKGCKIVHANCCWYVFEDGEYTPSECKCDKHEDNLKDALKEYLLWKEKQ